MADVVALDRVTAVLPSADEVRPCRRRGRCSLSTRSAHLPAAPSLRLPQFVAAVLSDVAGAASAATTLTRFTLPPATGTAADLEATYRATRELLADALSAGATDVKFGAALARTGVKAETREALVRGLSATARVATTREHVARLVTLAGGAGGTLVDFDWEVRHAVASDTLHATALTVCRLTLAIRDEGSGAVAHHVFECGADEVAGLIATLEAALRGSAPAAAVGGAVTTGGGSSGAASGLGSPGR